MGPLKEPLGTEDGVKLPDAIDRMRPSIVQIQSLTYPNIQTLGTGFVVGAASHVVTAQHVVNAVNAGVGDEVLIGFAGPDVTTLAMQIRGSFTSIGCPIVDASADDDLALIQLPAQPFGGMQILVGETPQAPPRQVRFATARCRDGTDIAVSGYPLAEPALVTNAGVLASGFTLMTGSGPPQERLLGDFTANPGNSGGPVYTTQDASVIGVLVAGRLVKVIEGPGSVSSGLTLIVPVAAVLKLLAKNGVAVVAQKPSKSGRR